MKTTTLAFYVRARVRERVRERGERERKVLSQGDVECSCCRDLQEYGMKQSSEPGGREAMKGTIRFGFVRREKKSRARERKMNV